MPKNRPSEENKEYLREYRELRRERSTSVYKRDWNGKRLGGSIKRHMPTVMHRLYREIGIILPRCRP